MDTNVRLRWAVQPLTIAVAVGLLAFGIFVWQLSVPQFLAYYDSGVYMAAALHFVSGALPYRDFTFVNPPGILLLLTPVALLGRAIGSHDALTLARVINSLATALNAGLLSWLVRRRGRVAMIIAGFGMALSPINFFVSSAVKLDPFCVLFVLWGSIVILSRDMRSGEYSSKALLAGGALFGVAGVIKLWAAFPFLALLICLTPHLRSRVWSFVAGAGAGFVVPSVPFFVADPGGFVHQIFTVQLIQHVAPGLSPGILWRLADFTGGFASTSIAPSYSAVVIAFGLFAALVIVAFRHRVHDEAPDVYLLLAAIITGAALLIAPISQLYYGYFETPFLIGLLAVSLARLGPLARRFLIAMNLSRAIRQISSVGLLTTGLVLTFALTLYVTTFYTRYAGFYGLSAPSLSAVNANIPPNACVVYVYVIQGVYSGRVLSSDPKCPIVVDTYGMRQSWGVGAGHLSKAYVETWKTYFEEAQYVVSYSPHTRYIPWTYDLSAWFAHHYRLIYGQNHVFIYAHRTTT